MSALYEFNTCPKQEQAHFLRVLNERLDAARAGSDYSRHELLAALRVEYHDYARARRRRENRGV